MAFNARRIGGIVAALGCLGAAFALHRGMGATAADEQQTLARNDANGRVRAVAELARRDLEKLIPAAVAGASVQELQEMVRQNTDAATFSDFLTNESSWKGFRAAPLSSAVFLDGKRQAATSPTFPEDAKLRHLIENAGVQGQGELLVNEAVLTTVVAARMPVVTRGDEPKEGVVLVARPLDLSAHDGVWLFSDGKQRLASKGTIDLGPLVGQEAQSPVVLNEGIASAALVQPGIWAWSLAPLPPMPRVGPPAPVIFGLAGLFALGALLFALKPSNDEKDRLFLETNQALRQSQEQLQRLSQQLQTAPPVAAQAPMSDRTHPSLEAPQPSRYEVIGSLGEGGMARISLAVTRGAAGFRRAFVLKRLRPEIMGNAEAVTQFLDEARLGSSLVHSNIVPVFDFGRDTEGYYLAQEYILGRDFDGVRKASLDQRRTAIELPLVLYVAHEALKALGYAHTRTTDSGRPLELVHRDVSPNNLMISAQGEVKLLDLGIAKSGENLTKTQSGMVKGNVFYMSPEQARGEPIDGRADLFSLGLVMFTAASGDTLYQGASNYELLSRAAKGLGPNEWQRIAALPPVLAGLLDRVLKADPSERFATAQDFAAAIPTSELGSSSAMQGLMTQLFGEDFRREATQLQANTA